MFSLIYLLTLLTTIHASHYFDDDMHSEEASWEFDYDTNGWGNSTDEERHAELHVRAGELQGNVIGPTPHFDSPVFLIVADTLPDAIEARHYIVMRMRYSGNCQKGRWLVRKGNTSLVDDQQTLPVDNPVWQEYTNPVEEHNGVTKLDFDVQNDGIWHVYYVPLFTSFKGNITQLRLHPVVADSATGPPTVGNTFSIDFIKIAKAPTIMKVEGCINQNFQQPEWSYDNIHHLTKSVTHTVHIDSVKQVPTLQFVQTLDQQTTRDDMRYSKTYNCLPEGGELLTITGTNFGIWEGAVDSVLIGGQPCTDVKMIVSEQQITCVTPPGLQTEVTSTTEWSNEPGMSYYDTTTGRPHGTTGYRGAGTNLPVKLTNGRLPGLFDVQNYFSYAISTPVINRPNVSNIASSSIDIKWNPPHNYWDAITVTGYSIKIMRLDTIPCYLASSRALQKKDVQYPDTYYVELGNVRMFVVGGGGGCSICFSFSNSLISFSRPPLFLLFRPPALPTHQVTITTLIDLIPGCAYKFSIATLVEDQDITACLEGSYTCRTGDGTRTSKAWQYLDLYGRRKRVPGARVSVYSLPTNEERLRSYDFYFTTFNANSTLNHSAVDERSSRGPTGNIGGEGHYGLNLVGDTNLENCNASYACCDGFAGTSLDEATGIRSTLGCSLVCSSIRQVKVPESYLLGEQSRNVTSNVLGEGIVIGIPSLLDHNATAKCGGSLRLTAPFARLSGAGWYPREMNIREGFDTTFRFRVTEPSTVCDFMDDVYTNCRSRGADGFAFVIQAESPVALGAAGMQLGYGGTRNSVAIEFDTRYSYELFDPYENHISVHSRGWRDRNSANHTYSFGSTVAISDLTDGDHDVRVVYDPVFDEALLSSGDSFTAVSLFLGFIFLYKKWMHRLTVFCCISFCFLQILRIPVTAYESVYGKCRLVSRRPSRLVHWNGYPFRLFG